MRRALPLLLLAALLGGCAQPLRHLADEAQLSSRDLRVLPTTPFPLQAVLPARIEGRVLRVYLEGDGYAWATPFQPSLDPTPRDLLVARLASQDPRGAVYLARPCQFVSHADCKPLLWTDQRFSRPVLDSLHDALDRLKRRYGSTHLELVGYSGGGTLALLLAAERDDVAEVQTLAGNLHPSAWIDHHRLSPLNGSLDPLAYRERLRHLPQRHLTGASDRVVPPLLAQRYAEALKRADCLWIHTVAASHNEGWEAAWATWRQQPLNCAPAQKP
ncbi:MAG TPA: alpha/beta hydrolase [Pseudomonas sp.]|nr:alpha/beta hydrolase [Pseudomonas sp.]